MSHVVIACYRVRAGAEEQVAEALREMVEPTRAEPGNRRYEVFRSPEDPAVFVLVEEYDDSAAFDAHLASDHFGQWLRGKVLPALEDRQRYDLAPLT
ncbi:antibiotic biosynthesis monooxygenase [Amycolatopsis acidicola]|uniref:Antibiotic biosynthesis monooxygenase n=1 Tax=Amycolatopsis acidicola TaxID=2596893 RepID=A0A5N0V0A9_9PSEU|nr:putative quinol monooxygenase [Amycolatopsis acidicola]KAA9158719.1 antibiotic biosynthesis monooxygenase [Amycolatopsis acidicola]